MRSIKFSAMIMWFYNKNQIQKMKIRKNEFEIKMVKTSCPEEYIEKVIQPFSPMIKRKELNIHIIREEGFRNFELVADWANFQLAVFNLVQNGIKYNRFRGDLIFLLSIKPIKKKIKFEEYNLDYILEMDIIDSGYGIEKEQQ